MKRPEYVAAATTVYAAAVRGETVSEAELERLKSVFSRSGFTDGYYTANRDGSMFGIRRHEDVTAAAPVLKELAHLYEKETPLVGISIGLTVSEQESRLVVTDEDGRTVAVCGEGGVIATNRPLDPLRAEEQLRKTGGTPYFVTKATVAIDEGLTLPMSAINALRRQALEELTARRSDVAAVVCHPDARPDSLPCRQPQTAKTVARLANATQWSADLTADAVILPLNTSDSAIRTIAATTAVGVEIPRGMFGQENAIRQQLAKAKAAGATFALCGNAGALPLAKEAELTAVGGFGLNLTNRDALAFYSEKGLDAATLSMELTFGQMRSLTPSPLPVGVMVYGHQPLMLTRNCPRQCAGASCGDCRHQGITDRTGTAFPVMCSGGCAEVLNSVPLWWGDKMAEIPAVDFHLFHFTIEDAARCAAVLAAYKQGGKPPAAITRGLYKRGVE